MYAVLRQNWFDPQKLKDFPDQVEEFDRIHAAQPGFAGNIVVDLTSGRRFMVNLWQDEAVSQAAFGRLMPEVDRLLTPLLSARSEFIGAGPVITEETAYSTARVTGRSEAETPRDADHQDDVQVPAAPRKDPGKVVGDQSDRFRRRYSRQAHNEER